MTVDYIAPIEFYCPNCGVLVGLETRTPAGTVLVIGNLELNAAHGKCHNPSCNAPFHWTAGDSLPPFIARRNL